MGHVGGMGKKGSKERKQESERNRGKNKTKTSKTRNKIKHLSLKIGNYVYINYFNINWFQNISTPTIRSI